MLPATSAVCHVPRRAAASFIDGDEVSSSLEDLVSNEQLLECGVGFIDLFELFLRPQLQRRVVRKSVRMPDFHELAIRLDDLRGRRSAFRVPERTARCHVVWSYTVLAACEPSRHHVQQELACNLAVTGQAKSGSCWRDESVGGPRSAVFRNGWRCGESRQALNSAASARSTAGTIGGTPQVRNTGERTRCRRCSGCDPEAGRARNHCAPHRESAGMTHAPRPDGGSASAG